MVQRPNQTTLTLELAASSLDINTPSHNFRGYHTEAEKQDKQDRQVSQRGKLLTAGVWWVAFLRNITLQ